MAVARHFILDLDGTLMPSSEVDNECYWAAVTEVFGGPGRALDLHGFGSVTDIGILRQWCRDALGRAPAAAEVEDVQAAFLAGLERAAGHQPECFEPMPGLRSWLKHHFDAGSRLAIATGGWGVTARWKLRHSGLDALELPLASSDDAEQRTDIMRRARQRCGADANDRICYVGDGCWDLDASRELGWDFIGIAQGTSAERLRAAGARDVVADFTALLPPRAQSPAQSQARPA